MLGGVNVVLTGIGGQGVVLASRILGQASIRAGLDVKIGETHGLAQREGAVCSHVRIGKRVNSMLIPHHMGDAILSLELLEAARNVHYLKEGGLLIVNDKIRYPVPHYLGEVTYPPKREIEKILSPYNAKLHVIRADELSAKAGNPKTANVVMLGALAQSGILPFSSEFLLSVVKDLVPAKALEANAKAFRLGMSALKGKGK